MNTIISEKLQNVSGICRKHHVATMAIFGSALTEKFNAESDIDILVKFENIPLLGYADNFFDLQFALEDLFERKIHLVSSNSHTNPYFIDEIERTKRVIYTT
jgi:predicted nucleotidyltransferase